MAELAGQHALHPTLIHAWKRQLLQGAASVFADGAKAAGHEAEALQAQLYEEFGDVQEKREVEGEKMVTRHILEQTRHNSDDLAAIKTGLDRVERKVDGLDSKIDGVESRLDNRIGSLERSLPKIVGDVMREVLRERGGKA